MDAHREKAEQNGDICNLCHNILSIKVTPIRGDGCYCKQQMCQFCYESFESISPENSSSDSEDSDINHNCVMGCGVSYNGGYIIAHWVELSRLDDLYGDIECPYECGYIGSRKDYIKQHKKSCMQCSRCGTRVLKLNHEITCILCKEIHLVCEHKKHLADNCTAERCKTCDVLINLHKKDICAECGTKIIDCESHYRECMFTTKTGKSIAKYLIKSECHRCGLVHFKMATNTCMVNISLMKKLGIETPYSKAIKEREKLGNNT